MKTAREKLIKQFLCAKTYTKLLNKEKKFYSLLLHEDFYLFVFQSSNPKFFQTTGLSVPSHFLLAKKTSSKSKINFLRIKYIISFFHANCCSQKNGSFFFLNRISGYKEKKNNCKQKQTFFVSLIFESIAFIILSNSLNKKSSSKFFGKPNQISISIQKPLEFLERRWQYSSFGFQGLLSYLFHPEVLIRILRKNFQDVSFLHLVRNLLHLNLVFFENFFIDCPSQKVTNILWNIYLLEIDTFFVSSCKIYCISEKEMFSKINPSLSCFYKINEWTSFLKERRVATISRTRVDNNYFCLKMNEDKSLNSSFINRACTYTYFRANINWFLFFQKTEPWGVLIKRWILLFFVRRLGYLVKNPIRFSHSGFQKDQMNQASYFFLAYLFQFPKKKTLIRINTKIFFFVSYFVKRIVGFLNPFDLILLLLSKKNFCSLDGRSKMKSGWISWTDGEIISRFNRIRRSFFLYYSGCYNRKVLSRIQYILFFSCAKTLACKHKKNLKQIYSQFGHSLKMQDFSLRTPSFLIRNLSSNSRLRFFYQNQHQTRTWNLDLKQIEPTFFHLEELYKKIYID